LEQKLKGEYSEDIGPTAGFVWRGTLLLGNQSPVSWRGGNRTGHELQQKTRKSAKNVRGPRNLIRREFSGKKRFHRRDVSEKPPISTIRRNVHLTCNKKDVSNAPRKRR